MDDKLDELRRRLLERLPGPGNFPTAIPDLRILRRDRVTELTRYFCTSCCVLIVQGCKQMQYGGELLSYGRGQYLIANAAIPVSGRIAQATREEPCLGLELDFDTSIMTDLLYSHGLAPDGAGSGSCISVHDAPAEMLDAFLRLTALLAKPASEQHILAPLIVREICFYLLSGPLSGELRRIFTPDTSASNIARAIALLRDRFTQKISIDELARSVNMSPSSFYRSFRHVTAVSPLQYQKQLRLEEAKRLMLNGECNAATASFRVGYVSPAQFSREYKKMFGSPPRADVRRLA